MNYEPELLFALDSLDEFSDWKNVYNVTGDDVCYCPICSGRVKLWNGQNKEKRYQKQRCFHHIDGMCSQESRIHFAYKTWLLDPDSMFKVDDQLHTAKHVYLEKTHQTSFGDYTPDITIETTDGKTFYIEVADTNHKTDDYICKWDELGNDVIEIDVNDQLSCVVSSDTPIFKLIYSACDGQCYIKKYVSKEYDNFISERKQALKRQDLINLKIRWEKQDWFWKDMQDFIKDRSPSSEDKLFISFGSLMYDDQVWIYEKIRNKSCVSTIKEKMTHKLFDAFETEVKNILNMHPDCNFEYAINHVSPLVYSIDISILFYFKEYKCHETATRKFKTKLDVLYPGTLYEISNIINELIQSYNQDNQILQNILDIEKNDYIKEIIPVSTVNTEQYTFKEISLKIVFQDYVYNRYIMQDIGEDVEHIKYVTKRRVHKKYEAFKQYALDERDNFIFQYAIAIDPCFKTVVETLNKKARQISPLLSLYKSEGHNGFIENINDITFYCHDSSDKIHYYLNLFFDRNPIKRFYIDSDYCFNTGADQLNRDVILYLEDIKEKIGILNFYVDKVNMCKNKLWKAHLQGSFISGKDVLIYIELKNSHNQHIKNSVHLSFDHNCEDYSSYVEENIVSTMREMMDGEIYDFRLMEVND